MILRKFIRAPPIKSKWIRIAFLLFGKSGSGSTVIISGSIGTTPLEYYTEKVEKFLIKNPSVMEGSGAC